MKPIVFALAAVMLAACGRGAEPAVEIPPAEARPANLGPSIKWVPESPRYQQIRRAAFAEGASSADRVDLGTERISRNGVFRVSVLQRSPAVVGAYQEWHLRVQTAQGAPVTGARISIRGGMPQHGHGLGSRPEILSGKAPGEYILRGVQFSMPGWWELSCYIVQGGRNDSVTFNVIAS